MVKHLKRPNLRVLIGLVLVILAVGGVYLVISVNTRTAVVYAAGKSMAPGQKLELVDLALAQVNLGPNQEKYLAPEDLSSGQYILNRPVQAGELIPRSAAVEKLEAENPSVVLPLASDLGADVREGSLVDVWSASKPEGVDYLRANLVAKQVRMVRVVKSGGGFDPRSSVRVEVQSSRDQLPYLLDAVANKDAISVVGAEFSNSDKTASPVGP